MAWKDTQKYQWVKNNPEKAKAMARKAQMKWKYGITQEEYDKMLADQGGVCAICKKESKDFCLDHDHSTKQNRGILCRTCNMAIGHFKESLENLRSAIKYLENFCD